MAHMMVLSFLLLFSIFVFGGPNVSEAHKAPAMYVFGDSLVDVGNNNYLKLAHEKANFRPYGIDFHGRRLHTGRFSNGKNVADFIESGCAISTSILRPNVKLKWKAAILTGISFASGGGGINNVTKISREESLALREQVDMFVGAYEALKIRLGTSDAEKLMKKSIFTIAFGSTDLKVYKEAPKSFQNITRQQFVNSLAQDLKQQLKVLYNSNARKFVIVGVGKMGCYPFERVKIVQEYPCDKEFNERSVVYNQPLKSMLMELKSELKNLHYSYFDTYFAMRKFIETPPRYGFKNVKTACCGLGKLNAETPCSPTAKYCTNREQYVFWDSVHPTQHAHRIFANLMYNRTSPYTFPMNLGKLLHVE